MPRALRDTKLDNRTARERLEARGRPYWRSLEIGLHLGYRRISGAPGRWCVRRYVGGQAYKVEIIGTADDYAEADGKTVLSFRQAQSEALKRRDGKPKAGPITVRMAVEAYLDHLENRSGTYDAGRRAQAFILDQLGDEKVEALTTDQLRKWHTDLAKMPRRKRTKAGEPQQFCEREDSDEGRRKRQSSANRILTVLKGALNFASNAGNVPGGDIEWRRVKPFRNTVSARIRYLTVAEGRRLINAADANFRPLVQAGLATGCRYGELGRLVVSDFNPDSGTLHIRQSKSGKPRHVVLEEEGAELFRQLCIGRGGGELIFQTPRGRQWLRSCQERPMREACARAGINPPVGFHQLRHTYASLAIMNGAPLMVVAKALGHNSTKMVEQHYGHLAPDYFSEAIRAAAPRFGALAASNVAALR